MKPAQMMAIILTALVVLYPLSPGPVALFYKHHHATSFPQPVQTFYAPLVWLCLNSKAAADAYGWYFKILGLS